jgi:hypothetical protein
LIQVRRIVHQLGRPAGNSPGIAPTDHFPSRPYCNRSCRSDGSH